jgi:hypothetical protein
MPDAVVFEQFVAGIMLLSRACRRRHLHDARNPQRGRLSIQQRVRRDPGCGTVPKLSTVQPENSVNLEIHGLSEKT